MFVFYIYKLLSASIGFDSLAFLAGAHPKIIPTNPENPTPNNIASIDITGVIDNKLNPVNDIANPSITPKIPGVS